MFEAGEGHILNCIVFRIQFQIFFMYDLQVAENQPDWILIGLRTCLSVSVGLLAAEGFLNLDFTLG